MKSKFLLEPKALFKPSRHQHKRLVSVVFGQILNAITINGFGPECKKTFSLLIQIIFIGKCFVLQDVAQGQRDDMWSVQGMGSTGKGWTLPRPAQAASVGDFWEEWSGAVAKEANAAVVRVLAMNLTFQKIWMMAIQLWTDVGVGWKEFKPQLALSLPPYW